ncbi:hypothetical protein [Thermomonas sp.]|uniref:hypothetical protein n=1 Tax=Thermomonas sp. TaxID=1971895 RepID=UPI00257B7F84|nr:hypothetical protein [Thermomonas sp.]
MELDDFKSAWQALDARLARHDRLQLELLRERRLDQARRNLRPLHVGLLFQGLLGVGLVVLGVACWKRNLDVPGLLAAGIALHAFGVLNIAFAGILTGLATGIDLAAPVLTIQKRLRLLLRLQTLNSNLCGAPWWIMWVVVVVGFAGLSPTPPAAATPTWIWISLSIGVVGTLATWAWAARAAGRPDGLHARIDDGTGGIRRSLQLLDDLEQFERD